MSSRNDPTVIEQLVSSYFQLPVQVDWKRATGLPLPDRYDEPRLTFSGLATSWIDLEQVTWRARQVHFVPGIPMTVHVVEPRVDVTVGKAELARWLKRFELPYRVELVEDALVIHSELAGVPVAEMEAHLEIENGWFVLQPHRASILGMPNYLAALFRTYLPLPPLAGNIELQAIHHEPDRLRLTFALEDFDEQVTPGLITRLQKRLVPTLQIPFANMLGPRPSRPSSRRKASGG